MTNVVFPHNFKSTLKRWRVKQGSSVTPNSLLCEFESNGVCKLKSKLAGTVSKLMVKEGDCILQGDVVAVIEECQHQTRWKNVCADCGAYLQADHKDTLYHAMEHSIPDLLVSQKTALSLGREDERRLLDGRRLVLLVDLDHTLIHTTTQHVSASQKDLFHFQLPTPSGHLQWYHTKFRPGIKTFLTRLSEHFEMHIYTFGVRAYAHTITSYMDPQRKFFQHRILSRDECFHPTLKTLNLKSLFPCGDRMVVIMDDREDVWQCAPNLIRVAPFLHFHDPRGQVNSACTKVNAPFHVRVNEPSKGEVNTLTTEINGGNVLALKRKRVSYEDGALKKKKVSCNVRKDSVNTADVLKRGVVDLEGEEVEKEKDKGTSKCGSDDDERYELKGVSKGATKLEQEEVDTACIEDSENDVPESCLENDGYASDSTNISNNKEKGNEIGEIGGERSEVSGVSGVSGDMDGERDKQQTSGGTSVDKVDTETNKNVKIDTKIYKNTDTKIDTNTDTKIDTNTDTNTDTKIDTYTNTDTDTNTDSHTDDYLLHLEEILMRIHTRFYSTCEDVHEDVLKDVKEIIPAERRAVLKGCRLVFSGVLPIKESLRGSWVEELCGRYGGVVMEAVVAGETTHVVGLRDGTQKVKMALKLDAVKVVSFDWLVQSVQRWMRQDEQQFPIQYASKFFVAFRDNLLSRSVPRGACNASEIAGALSANDAKRTAFDDNGDGGGDDNGDGGGDDNDGGRGDDNDGGGGYDNDGGGGDDNGDGGGDDNGDGGGDDNDADGSDDIDGGGGNDNDGEASWWKKIKDEFEEEYDEDDDDDDDKEKEDDDDKEKEDYDDDDDDDKEKEDYDDDDDDKEKEDYAKEKEDYDDDDDKEDEDDDDKEDNEEEQFKKDNLEEDDGKKESDEEKNERRMDVRGSRNSSSSSSSYSNSINRNSSSTNIKSNNNFNSTSNNSININNSNNTNNNINSCSNSSNSNSSSNNSSSSNRGSSDAEYVENMAKLIERKFFDQQ